MMTRYLFSFLLATLISQAAMASDLESLKTTHRRVLEAVQTADTGLMQAMVHDRAMGFFRGSQSPARLSERQTMRTLAPYLLGDLSSLAGSEKTVAEHRVVGDVGIVCSTVELVPAGEGGEPVRSRSTLVYSLEGARWKLVSWHTSEVAITDEDRPPE